MKKEEEICGHNTKEKCWTREMPNAKELLTSFCKDLKQSIFAKKSSLSVLYFSALSIITYNR